MQQLGVENIVQSKSTTNTFVIPSPIIQKKLEIGEPDDKYEVEADRLADQVVQMKPIAVDKPKPANNSIQRKCSNCEEEEHIQKKALVKQVTPLIQKRGTNLGGEAVASQTVTNGINQSRGRGKSLNGDIKQHMENGFGADFSNVRIHTDSNAVNLSQKLNAQAFTVGNDIYFNEGRYSPNSNSGKHLLAHELTHTLQQQGEKKSKIQKDEFSDTPPNANEATTRSFAGNDAMLEFFTGNSFRWLSSYTEFENANLDENSNAEVYESRIEAFLRYTAIGIMASHKQTITAKRNLMFSNRDGESRVQPIRDVAFNISRLEQTKSDLEAYKRNLNSVSTQALFRRGSLSDALNNIGRNSNAIMPLSIREELVTRYQAISARGSSDLMWLFVYGAAEQMKAKRAEQIQGIIASLSLLFTNYPVFSQLNASSVGGSYYSNNRTLELAAERSFADVLIAIDDVVRGIHSGDKDPLDMPKVIEITKGDLPPLLASYLEQMESSHRQYQFWRDMGLTIAEILVAFIPVVGPALALGIGAASMAIQGERMMDQMEMVAAGANPHGANPLGVNGPSTFEKAMFGIAGILSVVGAGSVFGTLRSGRTAALLDDTLEATTRRSGDLVEEGLEGGSRVDLPEAALARGGGDETLRNLGTTADVDVPTLRHLEIENEFITANPEGIRSIDETIGGVRYIEEIDLPNGHTWRKKPDGRWCRFSSRHCLSVEEQRALGLDAEDLDSMQIRRTGRRGEAEDLPGRLRDNLGTPPSSVSRGWQAHHIIPYELRNHQIIIFIRRNFPDQWNINDTLNGIFLPVRRSVTNSGNRSLHRGSHNFYSGVVETRLDEIRVRWIRDGLTDEQLLDEVMELQIYFHGRLMRGEIPLAREL